MADATDDRYTEPTDEQLVHFLAVYLPSKVGLDPGSVPVMFPTLLERRIAKDPDFRQRGIEQHRQFQEEMNRHHEAMLRGELQCDHIRPNGKQCVNHNEPGSYYCGLHKTEVKEE